MKFKGNGIVWNPKKNQILCRFQDGCLDTDDKEVIGMLRSLGYEPEDGEETAAVLPGEDVTADDEPGDIPAAEPDEAADEPEDTAPEPEKAEKAPKKDKPKNTGSSKNGKKK